MRKIRTGIAAEKRSAYEAALCNRLASLPALKHAHCVGAYYATGSEASLAAGIAQLRDLNPSPLIAYPLVYSNTGMLFLRFDADDDHSVLAAPKKFHDSIDETRILEMDAFDVLLVPGLAFDEQGHRLGQGGGYYDRHLLRVRPNCLTIGIAFDEQVIEAVPCDHHDVRLAYVLTPTRLIATS